MLIQVIEICMFAAELSHQAELSRMKADEPDNAHFMNRKTPFQGGWDLSHLNRRDKPSGPTLARGKAISKWDKSRARLWVGPGTAI